MFYVLLLFFCVCFVVNVVRPMYVWGESRGASCLISPPRKVICNGPMLTKKTLNGAGIYCFDAIGKDI